MALVVVVPLGLATKFYVGRGAQWVNGSAGGVFYVLFWCLLTAILMPRASAPALAGGVFAVTCLLEVTQLWHPEFLDGARATFLGGALLGSTFAWPDFFYYLVGAVAGWAWIAAARPDASVDDTFLAE